jgi:hypothetical protein
MSTLTHIIRLLVGTPQYVLTFWPKLCTKITSKQVFRRKKRNKEAEEEEEGTG